MKALLLAGGKGTRLWPISKKNTPKQALSPFGTDQKSLLQQSIDRLLSLNFSAKDISLVTAQEQVELLQTIWNPNNLGEIIAEPTAQNTGPAILLATKKLMYDNCPADESIFIFPSDAYIENLNLDFVSRLNFKDIIICYRVIPNRVEKNYGYIQPHTGGNIRKVRQFVEKPDQATAEKWYAQWTNQSELGEEEQYFWNSGIYTLTLNSLEVALSYIDPELCAIWKNSSYDEFLAYYTQLPKLPFDKMIAEKTFNLHSAELEADSWRDIGSWGSIHDCLSKNSADNVHIGQGQSITTESTKSCLVSSNKAVNVALSGVEDLVVVISGDNILITSKNDPQAMGDLLTKLDENHKDLL